MAVPQFLKTNFFARPDFHRQRDEPAVSIHLQGFRVFGEWEVALELRANLNRNLQEDALRAAIVRRVP
jgi:hypothetical protein